MKILLFGVQPYGSAGIPNYTRPLAAKYSELGHEVFCFHSGAYEKRYDWLMKPYLKFNTKDFKYEYAELINSPCWSSNFGKPDLDVNQNEINKIFEIYIKQRKPDVMHVNGFTGLPVSLLKIASEMGVKVFVTHHVYWPLCQKQVMIDYNGLLCEGPVNYDKCSFCTGKQNLNKLMFISRLSNTNKYLVNQLVKLKQRSKQNREIETTKDTEQINYNGVLTNSLKTRLENMITILNEYVIKNFCVSADVKKTLMRFGVREDKLEVQHIGSLIAENQLGTVRKLNSPLVIGNIGGVNHYKGIHVLVESVSKVKNNNFLVKIFGKYDEEYVNKLNNKYSNLPIEFTGRYIPADLPDILKQIDVMVLPSICNDTAPQTIFESFSGGIPIIASNIGGFPDFVKHDFNGLLFDTGDSDDLANKIDFILSNPDRLIFYNRNIPALKTITENAKELISSYSKC
ncbi:MAG: glycosyltransferase [Pedobacter sp.]